MATEFATFPLAGGKDTHPESEEGAKIFQSLADILYQQPGCQKVEWGTAIEKPEQFTMTIDWDTVEHHVAMQQKPVYGEFMATVSGLLDLEAGLLMHAHLSPFPPTAALSESGVTEYIVLYFPVDYSAADRKKTEDDLHKLLGVLGDHESGSQASASGWVVEKELAIPDSDEKGSAFIVLIGWDSIEAHMKFRETEAFKDNIYLLRKAKDLRKISVIHIDLKSVTKSN